MIKSVFVSLVLCSHGVRKGLFSGKFTLTLLFRRKTADTEPGIGIRDKNLSIFLLQALQLCCEILFQEFEAACQQTNSCVARKGIDYVRCVRECISPSCYSIIYKNDELEEGEIDVRLNSFKGCFTQRTKNRNL